MSDAHRVKEVEAVDRRGDAGLPCMANGGHCGGEVDKMHDFAAENVAEGVGFCWQRKLGVLRDGFTDGLSLHVVQEVLRRR